MRNFTLSTAWARYRAYHAKLSEALTQQSSTIKKFNKYVTLDKKTGYFATFGVEVRTNERDVLLSLMVFDQDGVIILSDVKDLLRTPWNWTRIGEAKREQLVEYCVANMCYHAGIPLNNIEPMTKVDNDVYALNVSWSDYEIYLGFLAAAQPRMELHERIKIYESR